MFICHYLCNNFFFIVSDLFIDCRKSLADIALNDNSRNLGMVFQNLNFDMLLILLKTLIL